MLSIIVALIVAVVFVVCSMIYNKNHDVPAAELGYRFHWWLSRVFYPIGLVGIILSGFMQADEVEPGQLTIYWIMVAVSAVVRIAIIWALLKPSKDGYSLIQFSFILQLISSVGTILLGQEDMAAAIGSGIDTGLIVIFYNYYYRRKEYFTSKGEILAGQNKVHA